MGGRALGQLRARLHIHFITAHPPFEKASGIVTWQKKAPDMPGATARFSGLGLA